METSREERRAGGYEVIRWGGGVKGPVSKQKGRRRRETNNEIEGGGEGLVPIILSRE